MINLFLGSVTLFTLGFLSGCFFFYIRQHKSEITASLSDVTMEIKSLHSKFDKLMQDVPK